MAHLSRNHWNDLKKTQIHTLDFSDLRFTIDDMKQLISVLPHTNIKTLNFSNNCWYRQYAVPIILAEGVEHTKVRTLHLANTSLTGSIIQEMIRRLKPSKLRTLNLRKNLIGFKKTVMEEIAVSLKESPIRILGLVDNGIDDDNILAFAKPLKETNIETLYLLNNKITDVGARTLAQDLQDTNIKLVDICHNNIKLETEETLRSHGTIKWVL